MNQGEVGDAPAEEVVDYLDDRFIQESGSASSLTGFPHSSQKRRQRSERRSSKKQRTTTALESGLNKPLGPDNKGFILLQKLGYQPESGKGIGRNEDGIVEPVAVVIKQDKLGLGKAERQEEVVKEKWEEIKASQVSYRQKKSQEHELRKLRQSLQKAAAVIQSLDEKEGIAQHSLWETENIDVLAKEEIVSQLDDSLAYLRQTKLYCLWCSIRYSSLHVSVQKHR